MKKRSAEDVLLVNDPTWYRDAIVYELHVRAFYDSNGDGIGDFAGLVEKLDYLQDLGITAIWLLPFYPSPLRDDGYDISDYVSVNPSYGTLKDFRLLLREAHARGIRVITELVINHTSSEHPWFQRARRAPPGSRYRDYYVWSDTPDRYEDARIIFQDFETSNWTWDPVAKAYYWHRFYSHQPDLNFENLEVQKAIFKNLDFWMDLGVDGMRLDAVPYLYEQEGTNCENLPKTHEFLRALRRHIDKKYKNRMLLAEANQWPEDAAQYFGDGDECHMNFHFPLMPRMFMAVQLENCFPIHDILDQTPELPPNCQWAVFLRNHDELTLEMVTDEDRDYMYRVYAEDPQARINLGIRRRLAPLLKLRRKIELMNGLLFSMPGTPVLYYGDEIGMGDNIYLGDRNSVRTPMQWSGDRNAGFSRANPQKLFLPVIIDPEYHFEALNVEAQQNNTNSLLWWMKRLIALRKYYRVFGRGDLRFYYPDNSKVLAFSRTYEDERVLVVANLSRFSQYVELDLREYVGMVPVELFGRTEFPPIGELPYLLTLGPYDFHWFLLEEHGDERGQVPTKFPSIEVTGSWERLFAKPGKAALEHALPEYLVERRWFRGKARKLKGVSLVDAIAMGTRGGRTYLALVQADYAEGSGETYVVPLAFAQGQEAATYEEERSQAVVAKVQVRASGDGRKEPAQGVLYDAFATESFAEALLDTFGRRKTLTGSRTELQATTSRLFREVRADAGADLAPTISRAEQSNTSVFYGDRLVLKVFRSLDEGVNPDLEMTRFLTTKAGVDFVPPLAGSLSVQGPRMSATLGILQGYVPNQGDAWKVTLDSLDRFFERALAHREGADSLFSAKRLIERVALSMPPAAVEIIGPYLPFARLLGKRSAELHLALGSVSDDPAFAPEPFSQLYQRSLYQSARTRLRQTFQMLRSRLRTLSEADRALARGILEQQAAIDSRLKAIYREKLDAVRIRCHGDFHLGQVLYTGKDFVIIDFEGEPARSIGERRFKRSPLRDVAGMLRSFHYATVGALRSERIRPEDAKLLEPWARMWNGWVSAAYLGAYLEAAKGAPFLLPEAESTAELLDFFLLEKCIYELGYELNNRPDWLGIPLTGLRELLGGRIAS